MPVERLVKLVGDAVSALSRAPTPRYNPSVAPVGKWLRRFENEVNEKGIGLAYNKLRQESRLRAGTYVGQDYNGNRYFEDKNAPYGDARALPLKAAVRAKLTTPPPGGRSDAVGGVPDGARCLGDRGQV
jgi:hypothetical protein